MSGEQTTPEGIERKLLALLAAADEATATGDTERVNRLSGNLDSLAAVFDQWSIEDIEGQRPESAAACSGLSEQLRRLAYNHRTAASYQGDDSLDPEQIA